MLTTDLTIPVHYHFLKTIRACVVDPGVQQLGFHSNDPTARRFGKGRLGLFAVPSVMIDAECPNTVEGTDWCSAKRLCALREWVTVKTQGALECLGRGYWIGRPCAWTYRIGDGQPKTFRFTGEWIFLCSSDRKLDRVPDRPDRLAPNHSWFRSDTRVMSAIHRSMRCECYVLTGEGFNELDRIERGLVVAAAQRPPLPERARAILRELLGANAFDGDHLVPTEILAERIGADANSLKHPVAEMKKQGLVHTRKGRNGGVWLSIDGKTLAVREFPAIGAHQ